MKLLNLLNSVCRIASVAFCAATVVSCAFTEFENGGIDGNEREDAQGIWLAVPELSVPNVSTRVVIDAEATPEAGQSVEARWSEGDSFSLWAAGSAEENIYRNMKFDYMGTAKYGDQTLFWGKQVPLMAEDGYTYRAYAPYTDNVDLQSNTITYEIPAVQSGRYDGALDIMRAKAERTDRRLILNTHNHSEDADDMDLLFRHETHILRIVMPSNPFEEQGTKVGRIRIIFPTEVVGTLTFDAVSDDAPVFEGVSNEILVDFGEEGLDAGEPFWVFAAPADVTGQPVRFVAADTEGEEVTFFSQSLSFGNLESAHITPVNLTMKVRPSSYYTVSVTDHSKLGEAITALSSMTLPEGAAFADLYFSRTKNDILPEEGSEIFKVKILDDCIEALEGQNIDFILESTHAENLVPNTQTVTSSGCELTAPYLFFEDFSEVEDVSNYDAYGSRTSSWPSDYSAVTLLASGWTGARVGAQAGTAIRIACRRETSARYYARVDSAPIANIKDGTGVKVRILFDYGADRYGGSLFTEGQNAGASVGQYVYLGYVTDNTGYSSSNNTMEKVSEFLIPSSELNGSYTNLPNKDESFEIEECRNNFRLTWRTYPEYNAGVNNNTCWLYLDNIRVSISE